MQGRLDRQRKNNMSTKSKIEKENKSSPDKEPNVKFPDKESKTNYVFMSLENIESRIYTDQTGQLPKKGKLVGK